MLPKLYQEWFLHATNAVTQARFEGEVVAEASLHDVNGCRRRWTHMPPLTPYRHTIIFDDSLNQAWTAHTESATALHSRSAKGARSKLDSCARSLRLRFPQPGSTVRLRAGSPITDRVTQLSLQLWAQRAPRGMAFPSCRRGRGVLVQGQIIRSGWHCDAAVA